MSYVIGIGFMCRDVTAGLYRDDGTWIGEKRIKTEPYLRDDGSEEFEPEDWAEACFTAVREVVSENNAAPEDVACISISCHNSEVVLLDGEGKPVMRSRSGRDVRYPEEDARIRAVPALRELVGNGLIHENLAARLLWLKKHEPAAFSEAKTVLYPKDYLNYRLTGVLATDETIASYTQLFDVVNRTWSRPMTEALDLPFGILPPVVPSRRALGGLTAEACEKTGLTAKTLVNAGMTNKACIELGSLSVEEGDDMVTLNVFGDMIVHSSRPGPEGSFTCCSGIPDSCMLIADNRLDVPNVKGHLPDDLPEDTRRDIVKKTCALLSGLHEKSGVPCGKLFVRCGGIEEQWLPMMAAETGRRVFSIERNNGAVAGCAVSACVTAGIYEDEAAASRTMIRPKAVFC